MNFNIFKTKQKTPHDIVKHVKDAIHKLDGQDKRKVKKKGRNTEETETKRNRVLKRFFKMTRQQRKYQNI